MASPLANMEKRTCEAWSEKESATKSTGSSTCKMNISRSQQSVIDLIKERPGSVWASPTFNFVLCELVQKNLVRYEVNAFGQKEWYTNE